MNQRSQQPQSIEGQKDIQNNQSNNQFKKASLIIEFCKDAILEDFISDHKQNFANQNILNTRRSFFNDKKQAIKNLIKEEIGTKFAIYNANNSTEEVSISDFIKGETDFIVEVLIDYLNKNNNNLFSDNTLLQRFNKDENLFKNNQQQQQEKKPFNKKDLTNAIAGYIKSQIQGQENNEKFQNNQLLKKNITRQ